VKWSRWLTWLGVVIALAGVVIAIWLQFAVDYGAFTAFDTQSRLQAAAIGFGMIASGALLSVAAQIMGMMQVAAERQSSN
jgi:hypothetical protein